MFWAIAIVLLVLWLAGLLAHIGGPLVHILLVIGLGLIIYRLVKGKKIP
ncbi:MAG: lmo0937 family membrane protein [bacterium]